VRVGIGYDSHRFAQGRKLILGGVEIAHDKGLTGHSDADAVAHALTDAILGAAGLGDIGRLFPPSDPRWRDANSVELLGKANLKVLEAGFSFVHADITVIAEQPKIAPHADAMEERLAEALVVPATKVSVKAKTNEGMGWIGRGEGIAVIAVATLQEPTGPRMSGGMTSSAL
jgi:2-C-methyl-D-erythritol 2,4-cyclodiphosphate synthase